MRIRAAVLFCLFAGIASAQSTIRPGGGGGSSTITAGTTATSGCTDGAFLYSLTSLIRCGAVIVASSTGAVTIGSSSLGTSVVPLTVTPGTGATVSTIVVGSNTAASSATPVNVSFGGTYGSNALGSQNNLKWDLYNDSGSNRYGIGMSAGFMEFQAGSAGSGNFSWFTGSSTERMRLNTAGNLKITGLALTAATMTVEFTGELRDSVGSYTWTNAQVAALGASLTGDIKVATLPAKTVVRNAYVVITGAAAGTTTLTVACGRVSAGYIDYIVASDAQAAANTVYGDASGERGTNLTGYDLPSYTATTDVYCHFISTGANLSAVTGSTGRVVLSTTLVP